MKIKLDEFISVDITLPEELTALEFKGWLIKIQKIIKINNLDEEISEQIPKQKSFKEFGEKKYNMRTAEEKAALIERVAKAKTQEEIEQIAQEENISTTGLIANVTRWQYKGVKND